MAASAALYDGLFVARLSRVLWPWKVWRFAPARSVLRFPFSGARQRPICICAGDMVSYARFRPLAQLVEHGTFNAGVAGPSPARPTIYQAPQASA